MPSTITIACNQYGTRALQHLLTKLSNENDFALIGGRLKGKIFQLIKDLNGNHFVQQAIISFPSSISNFIYEEVNESCKDVAVLKQSGCIYQKLIKYGSKDQLAILAIAVVKQVNYLFDNEFGNFIIQQCFNLGIDEVNEQIWDFALKNISYLCKRKFSSNIIDNVT